MSYTLYKTVNFGPARTGLSTVGYTTTGGTRVTAGVAEVGTATGVYGATVTFAADFAGAVLWDDGGTPAAYAAEDVNGVNLTLVNGLPAQGAGLGAVWDALEADHTAVGSFGALLATTPKDSGTAQAGGASSITLRTGSVALDTTKGVYRVELTGGTGAGQDAPVLTYNGTTKVATIAGTWDVAPDSTTTYAVWFTAAEVAPATVTAVQSGLSTASALSALVTKVDAQTIGKSGVVAASPAPTRTGFTVTLDAGSALSGSELAASIAGLYATFTGGSRNAPDFKLVATATINSTTSVALTFASPGFDVLPVAGEAVLISG